MSYNYGNGHFIKFVSDSIYFVINYVTVARLGIDGMLECLDDVYEGQSLPAAPGHPRGWDSSREVLYISLSDNTRLLEVDGDGHVLIAGSVVPGQTIAWTGQNWEINSNASKAWLNIAGVRPAELSAAGNLLLADEVVPGQAFIALPEKLTLSHAVAGDYEFDELFWFKDIPTDRRKSLASRAGGHGAKDRSDGFCDERIIEVRGYLRRSTNALYEAAKDELYAAIARTDLQLATNFDRYMPLAKLMKVKEQFLSGEFQCGAEYSIQFLQEIPFWISQVLTQQQQAITSSPQSFNVIYGGSAEVYPLLRITADEDITNLAVANVTDGREFTYADEAFTDGEVVEVDGEDGTVTLVGSGSPNRISKFDGPFLRLLPNATNEIRVTGGDCTVVVEYRERYY